MQENTLRNSLDARQPMLARSRLIPIILLLACQLAFSQERLASANGRDILQIALLDGGKMVYSYEDKTPTGKKFFVMNGDTPSEAYDWIGKFMVSSDGSILSFIAKIGEDWYAITGAQRFGPYSEIEEPIFLKDGKTLAYRAKRDAIVSVRIGNTEYTFTDETETAGNYPLFLDSGANMLVCKINLPSISYMLIDNEIFVHAKSENHRIMVLYGDQAVGPFDFATNFIKGPKGDSFAFLAFVDEKAFGNWKSFVVSGQNRYGPYDAVTGLCLSPKREELAYVAKTSNSYFVFSGSEKFGPYDEVALEPLEFTYGEIEPRLGLRFSPDGERLVFRARKGNDWYLAGNGVQYGPYEKLDGGVAFSPDGSSLAFSAMIENRWYAIHDGKAEGPYDRIGFDEKEYDPTRSFAHLSAYQWDTDDKTLLYPVSKNQKRYLVAGSTEMGPYDFITAQSQSDEGHRYAAVVGVEGRAYVLNNGKLENPSDYIATPILSRDGTMLSYISETKKQSFLVTNGNRLGPYDSIGIFGVSLSRSTVLYQALKNDEWYLMDESGNRLFTGFSPQYPVTFAPDEKGFAAVMYASSRKCLVTNLGTFGPYDYVWEQPVFSEDGTAISFTYSQDSAVRQGLILNGRLLTGTIQNGQLIFVEDGTVYRR